MSGHQHSALLLHGLEESDRHWILAQLAEDDRRILGEHLAELKDLGIPADAGLVQEAITAHGSLAPSGDPLHAATAAQMQVLLSDEPQWLVRQVLALEDWPWRRDFLALLPHHERTRHNQPGALSPKVAESLRQQLAQRLMQCRSLRAEPRPPRQASNNLIQALQNAVRRWL